MDSTLKVTDQSEEIAFDDMVGGDQIINIPLFQRSYKWTERNLSEYWDDISGIMDGSALSQFLGVLVLVPQARRVGQPFLLDVVDGQQRLSTCYLTALATVFVAAKNEKADWAIEATRSYLLTRRFSTRSTNTKLIPSAADREQFRKIWSLITSLPSMRGADWKGDEPTPPQPSGADTGRMLTAFKKLVKRVETSFDELGFSGIEGVFEIAIRKLSFVTINLRNPTAAPAIFERLNARGERINISDLVRNEIFARVADDAMVAKNLFEAHWEPFIARFSSRELDFEKILFPYGLTLNSNITKADLFQALRSHWGEDSSPQSIIEEMDKFTPALFALETGDTAEVGPPVYAEVLADLNILGAPSSIYPFAFQLTREVSAGSFDAGQAVAALRVLETFLFRRAISGIEPTGLHAVFKGLWDEAGGVDLSEETVSAAISRRTTVPWPNDHEFKTAIETNDLYIKRAAKYALRQFERSLRGETPEDDCQIEHVFPQTPGDDWEIEPGDEADAHKNVWGNLIPISESMNPALSNRAYAEKKPEYANSIFATARAISSEYDTWTIETIRARGAQIADWAVSRWPHNRS